MAAYNAVVELFDEMAKIAINTLLEFDAVYKREKFSLLESIEEDIQRFKETGVLTFSTGNLAANETRNEAGNNAGTSTEPQESKRRGRTKQRTIPPARSSSLKENSREADREPPCTTGRRKAFVEASQSVNNKATANITQAIVVKVERLTEDFIVKHGSETANLPIKKEKTDMLPPLRPPIRQTRKRKGTQNTDTSNSDVEGVQVKEEQVEPESRKRKVAAEPASTQKHPSTSRDSNVEVIPESVDIVNLVDSEEEETEKLVKGRGRPKTKQKQQKKETNSSTDGSATEDFYTARVTRTKTRNAVKNKEAEESAAEKRRNLHSSSTEDEAKEKTAKRTKAKKPADKKNDVNNASVYEDALSHTENSKHDQVEPANEQANANAQVITQVDGDTHEGPQIINETVIVSKPPALNETVVIEKPKNPVVMNQTVVVNKVANDNQLVNDDLMTDDEDVVASPVRPPKTNKLKQVFSPYANSPVKKRVEAFEKLGAEASVEMSLRMTRTKTKAKEQENASSENEATLANNPNPGRHGAIPKLQRTPIIDHRTLIAPATCDRYKTKGYDRNISGSNNISVTVKSKSALKASQVEFRERELKRKQKEEEALSKKEALIQQQIEERRRKREERQLKAQQMRDALEKEKKKMLESAERIKQEKIKQVMAEKEERLLKQQEEAARKRAQALKKATEEKQKEEEKKKQEQAKNEKREVQTKTATNHQHPPYLRYETPPLPTEDCYDSDDSNASKPVSVPYWQKKEVLHKTLRWYMRYVDVEVRHLFCNGPQTVNLQEVFPSIEPHKLKRTSSAIWNASGLAKLPTMAEEEENTS